MIVGIDASNIKSGGGVTHLIEILNYFDPTIDKIDKIIVWSSDKTLDLINEKQWILKQPIKEIKFGFFAQIIWQKYYLPILAKKFNCNIIFSPGGNVTCNFRPIVTMCRNMLPFEKKEIYRYGFSFLTLKWLLLKLSHANSFRKTNGLIFLSRYAKTEVCKQTKQISNNQVIIQHGINQNFFKKPKIQKSIKSYSRTNPFNIIYVSPIAAYKHQCLLIKSIFILIEQKKLPIKIKFIGPIGDSRSFYKFKKALYKADPDQKWSDYIGGISHKNLIKYLQEADLGVFLSTCENLPNTMIEKMASGLPILSLNNKINREILGPDSFFINELNIISITKSIETFLKDIDLRKYHAKKNYDLAKKYNWKNCTRDTFGFIRASHELVKNKKFEY